MILCDGDVLEEFFLMLFKCQDKYFSYLNRLDFIQKLDFIGDHIVRNDERKIHKAIATFSWALIDI